MEATFLFVTWRLAGSIPRAGLPHPHTGATLSAGRAFLVLDREVDKAAFGPVWLRDARVANMVADALLHGETGRQFYQLRAWVIMPNHVHVLLLPQTSLPVMMRWRKGCSTARPANLIWAERGRPSGRTNPSTTVCEMKRNWTVWFTMWSTTRSAPVWQRIHALGIGRARDGWEAKAPASRLARIGKCRNSRRRLKAGGSQDWPPHGHSISTLIASLPTPTSAATPSTSCTFAASDAAVYGF
jgi:REP element-mobilizing transposase RayT